MMWNEARNDGLFEHNALDLARQAWGGSDAPRALVVDDNAYSRAICRHLLGQTGIGAVTEARQGAEAILWLLQARFTLVLLDWHMPDINGAGVMQILRDPRFGAGNATPVILMTAYPTHDTRQRALALGVNAILSKPFSAGHLGAAVQRVLPRPFTTGDVAFV